jgi:branched-chain amino acid transport system substrate-binding protein
MEAMRAAPISDAVTKNAKLRIDGRVERDQYLLEAKSPSESKGEWDILKVVAKIPAAEATRSLEAGGCPMVKGEQPKP